MQLHMVGIIVFTGQVVAPAVTAGTDKLAAIVQAQELLVFYKIQQTHPLIPQECHKGVELIGILIEIIQDVFKAPQEQKLISQAVRVPPGTLQRDIQYAVEHIMGQIQDLIGLIIIHDDLAVLELSHIIPVRQDGVDVIGAVSLTAGGPLGVQTHGGHRIHIGDRQILGADTVIADDLLPVDLLAQAVFPHTGQIVLALQHCMRNKLIPGILRVDEDQ